MRRFPVMETSRFMSARGRGMRPSLQPDGGAGYGVLKGEGPRGQNAAWRTGHRR